MITLIEFLTTLAQNQDSQLQFILPTIEVVPAHYHVTEVGLVEKKFVDCGGKLRNQSACVLQLWVDNDINHRLDSTKLLKIMQHAYPAFLKPEMPVEIEYESSLISQYIIKSFEVTGSVVKFLLETKHTDCLAKDVCFKKPGLNVIANDGGCCGGSGDEGEGCC